VKAAYGSLKPNPVKAQAKPEDHGVIAWGMGSLPLVVDLVGLTATCPAHLVLGSAV